jgi:class 3 adenylate cyclase
MEAPPAPARQAADLAILFADIAGSSGLYARLGDQAARGLIGECLGAIGGIVARCGGSVVKTVGDEVMATFAAPKAALQAASEMQQAVSGRRVADGRSLAIRVGLHAGAVLLEEGDVFGDAVNVAARLVAAAKAGQTLTSGTTLAAAGADWTASARLVDITALRGREGLVEVYESVWAGSEATLMRRPPEGARPPAAAWFVTGSGAARVALDAARPTLNLGRDGQNDLILTGDFVSRMHARIEFRRGRCVLTDESTNGTYLLDAAGRLQFVRRDSLLLAGTGLLGMGEAPREGAATTVRFWVAEAG